MELSEFIAHLKDYVDGLEEEELAADTELKSLEEWNSLAVISTLSMIASEYDKIVSGNALKACSTIGEIFELVRSQQ